MSIVKPIIVKVSLDYSPTEKCKCWIVNYTEGSSFGILVFVSHALKNVIKYMTNSGLLSHYNVVITNSRITVLDNNGEFFAGFNKSDVHAVDSIYPYDLMRAIQSEMKFLFPVLYYVEGLVLSMVFNAYGEEYCLSDIKRTVTSLVDASFVDVRGGGMSSENDIRISIDSIISEIERCKYKIDNDMLCKLICLVDKCTSASYEPVLE